MADLVRFELEDGTSVLFEAADGGVVRVGGSDAVDGGNLHEKLAAAARTAQAVSAALREKVSPDELSLELGLKVSGQARWFVAQTQAEGSLKVTLKWRNAPTGDDLGSSSP